jgi:hypothetical protein
VSLLAFPNSKIMACFRIDLSNYAGVNEAKLDAWAKHFFKNYSWKRPVMFGEVVESDYKRQQLQTLVNNNLKNWGTQKTKRYCKQWISRIMPWDFAQECPAKKVFADHKIQRLAAILSLEKVGLRALKQHAEPTLAKKACEDSQEKWKTFVLGDMDMHKAQYGDGNPEGWKLLRIREEELKDDYGKALDRLRVCDEEVLAKKQRVV